MSVVRRRPLTWVTALSIVAAAGCSSSGSGASPGSSAPPSAAPSTERAAVEDDPAETTVPAPVTTPVPNATEIDATDPTGPSTEPPAAAPPYDFSAVSQIVGDFVGERELDGAGLIVVDRDDGVIHEEHWGIFGPDRISLVASSSKMITAGVLMRLHDDGLLDVDAPVADVVDWGAANPDVTPAQLVSNSSGLVGLLPDPAYEPYVCQFLPVGTLQECAETIFTTTDDDADIVGPDTAFRYGGAQWQVAGAVAEVASGRTWAELVEEIYIRPCGLQTLGYNNHFAQLGPGGFEYPSGFDGDPSTLAPTANPNMEGGVYVTTGDYGRLLLMHLRGGMCDDQRVLSAAAIERLHADRIAGAYGGSAGPGTGYGMGWWVDRSSGRISDAGAYGSVPWLDLDDGYGAYLVIEADAGTGAELANLLYDPVEAAVLAGR